ncbi:hypothetical protein ACW9H6_20910 [Pseudomonas sp. SDO528_S397]
MLSSRLLAPGGAIAYSAVGQEPQPVEAVSGSAAIKRLLEDLFEAHRDNKPQTARDLRDTLNGRRENQGDRAIKDVLGEMIENADTPQALRDFLRWLLTQLFPEDDPAPSPSPGLGPRANRSDFPPGEVMSNKPITEGAKHFNYTPDTRNPGKKPDNIWSGFSQGPDGNCVTVSAIKAAMMRFGQKPTDVFQEVKENGSGFDVTQRDGFKLHLSANELQMAAREARFKGDDPGMMTDANFMYAVSAKRAQLENNDGVAGRSYSAALRSLNDGEHSREGLDRLGLRNHYRAATRADLANGRLGTVEYGGHSMAVIGGRVELWGTRGGVPEEGIATVLF